MQMLNHAEKSITETKSSILSKYIDLINKESEIYIFGAKFLGKTLSFDLKKSGYNVVGFLDNNQTLKDTVLNGINTSLPSDILDKKNDAVIIIASLNYHNQILDQLMSLGFKNIVPYAILTILDKENFIVTPPFENILEDVIENYPEYKNFSKMLKDEESKTILNKLIEFRQTLDFKIFPQINDPTKVQYFEDFVPSNNDIFVDGGAFDGDTVLKFLNFQNNYYKKIYFFEPDEISMQNAKINLQKYENVEYHQKGLSDCDKVLSFNSRADFGSTFSDDGDIKLPCSALKNIVKEDKCFIKLDIEGAEVDCIKGAERFFENGSPFAICVYHKPTDLWQIPKLIHSLNPKYTFYLRHYSNTIFETVLYGVIEDD